LLTEGRPSEDPPAAEFGDVVLYSDRPVIRAGLLEMLATDVLVCTLVCTRAHEALEVLGPATHALVLDAGSLAAPDVQRAAIAGAVPTVVLVDDRAGGGHLAVGRPSQAVLALSDIDAEALALALAAAARGLMVLSPDVAGSLAPTGTLAGHAGQDRLIEALALAAGGLRDAEIAVRMNLSESAARKLVQRAVHRMGARTRSEAVVKALHDGQLD